MPTCERTHCTDTLYVRYSSYEYQSQYRDIDLHVPAYSSVLVHVPMMYAGKRHAAMHPEIACTPRRRVIRVMQVAAT